MGMFYGWIPPRSNKHPKRDVRFRPLSPAPISLRMEEYRSLLEQCPSVGTGVGNATIGKVRYEDPTMQLREDKARQVKHTVAPICNKGGLQLITDEADLKTVGRKV